MKRYFPIGCAIAFVVLFLNCSTSFAVDPNTPPTSVRWVINHQDSIRADGRWVVMRGVVTSRLNGDTYVFDDGTGTIQLDSNAHLPVGKPVTIIGRIDEPFLNIIGPLEIDVKRWHPAPVAPYQPVAVQQAPQTVYSQPAAPAPAPPVSSIRYGTIVNGSVKSPYSDFSISLSGLAQGSKVFDANTGQPFLVP